MTHEDMKILLDAKIVNIKNDLSLVLRLDQGEELIIYPLRDEEGNNRGSWGFSLNN